MYNFPLIICAWTDFLIVGVKCLVELHKSVIHENYSVIRFRFWVKLHMY